MAIVNGDDLGPESLNRYLSTGNDRKIHFKACAVKLVAGEAFLDIDTYPVSNNVTGFGSVTTYPTAGKFSANYDGAFTKTPSVVATLQKATAGLPPLVYDVQLLYESDADLLTKVYFCIRDASGVVVTSDVLLDALVVHIHAVGLV